MKKIMTLIVCCLASLTPITAISSENNQQSDDTLTLEWLDLIPLNERNLVDSIGMPLNHEGEAQTQSKLGGVRQELNGSQVKIPGFVIPLEGDQDVVTEFLLVPYMGACIHVPPPPPNQIIYVRFKGGAPIQDLWDVVNVIGELKTETVSHELAEVGYVIEGTALAEYEDD